jgi:hypothetical protein
MTKSDWKSYFARPVDPEIANWVFIRDQFGVGEDDARAVAAYAVSTGQTEVEVLQKLIRLLPTQGDDK